MLLRQPAGAGPLPATTKLAGQQGFCEQFAMTDVATHLTFQGNAAEALELYSSVFSDLRILETELYSGDDGGVAGAFKLARTQLGNQSIVLFDSPIPHAWDFTPAMSLFVNFPDEADLQGAFDALSANGQVFMPVDNYGFSKSFAWVADRFGVSSFTASKNSAAGDAPCRS